MAFAFNALTGKLDLQPSSNQERQFIIETIIGTVGNANGLTEVKGEALPGSATTASVWRISKMTYDGVGNIVGIDWAQNAGVESALFVHSWADALAASLTFGTP